MKTFKEYCEALTDFDTMDTTERLPAAIRADRPSGEFGAVSFDRPSPEFHVNLLHAIVHRDERTSAAIKKVLQAHPELNDKLSAALTDAMMSSRQYDFYNHDKKVGADAYDKIKAQNQRAAANTVANLAR